VEPECPERREQAVKKLMNIKKSTYFFDINLSIIFGKIAL
tara:strand:- start:904 stop:1023 length:120 start_codon:yes stop_codon:yes gene_type:complete